MKISSKKLVKPSQTTEMAPPTKETAVMVQTTPRKEIIMEGDPEAQLAFAQKAATALMKVAKPINIQGKEYLPFGSWQILGRFFGSTVGVEWTTKIEEGGRLLGYEARAIVYRSGEVISSAEASCMKTERNWSSRDEYAIKSMAQTRACAKALRNAFGWVAEMANYSSTPFEEMDGIIPKKEPMKPYVVQKKYPDITPENDAHGLDGPEDYKSRIKEYLGKLGKEPDTQKSARFDVKTLTNIFWEPGVNDEEVVNKLAELVLKREEGQPDEDEFDKIFSTAV